MKFIDYHIHPNYSIDAQPYSIDEYCKRAVELKMDEICFTTHIELDPKSINIEGFSIIENKKIPVLDDYWFNCYMDEISIAQGKYKNKLKIYSGFEINYDKNYEKNIKDYLEKHNVDYYLLGIHSIDNIFFEIDEYAKYIFEKYDFNEFFKKYFVSLENAVNSKIFNTVGHLDLYKKIGVKFYDKEVFNINKDIVEKFFKNLIKNDMLLEINTASFRKNFDEPYPSFKFLEIAKDTGLKYIITGSDAHKIDDLGFKIIETSKKLIKKFGFEIIGLSG